MSSSSGRKAKVPAGQLGPDGFQTRHDPVALGLGEQAGPRERAGPRHAAHDVVGPEALIEGQRAGEAGRRRIGRAEPRAGQRPLRRAHGSKRGDVVHDPARDLIAGRAPARATEREPTRRPEPHGQRPAPGQVHPPPGQGLVGPANPRRDHRHAGAQREQRDPGQAALEPAAHAEGSLGKDADHAAVLQRGQRLAERAHVRACEVQRDGADAPVQQRMQRRRAPHARHHEEGDRMRYRHRQHHAVEIVVVVGRDDVRTARGQGLELLDGEIEPAFERGPGRDPQRLIEKGEWRRRAGDAGARLQRGRPRHVGGYSTPVTECIEVGRPGVGNLSAAGQRQRQPRTT